MKLKGDVVVEAVTAVVTSLLLLRPELKAGALKHDGEEVLLPKIDELCVTVVGVLVTLTLLNADGDKVGNEVVVDAVVLVVVVVPKENEGVSPAGEDTVEVFVTVGTDTGGEENDGASKKFFN